MKTVTCFGGPLDGSACELPDSVVAGRIIVLGMKKFGDTWCNLGSPAPHAEFSSEYTYRGNGRFEFSGHEPLVGKGTK
jgi:hypothetical protein